MQKKYFNIKNMDFASPEIRKLYNRDYSGINPNPIN